MGVGRSTGEIREALRRSPSDADLQGIRIGIQISEVVQANPGSDFASGAAGDSAGLISGQKAEAGGSPEIVIEECRMG